VGDPVGLPKGIDCTGNSNLACFKDSYQVIWSICISAIEFWLMIVLNLKLFLLYTIFLLDLL
jgi:hypothetical protein